jgi:hypothetical protein
LTLNAERGRPSTDSRGRYPFGRSPEQRRNDLATYLGFALALIVPAAGWIAWVWRGRKKQNGGTWGLPDLDHLADHLAEAVNEQ